MALLVFPTMSDVDLAAHAQLAPPQSPFEASPVQTPLFDANDDSDTTDEDHSVTVDVLANDSHLGPGQTQVDSTTMPSHGTARINPDSTITYTPNQDFFGSDSFEYTATYSINDKVLESDTATVSITVNPVNDAPVANDDSAQTSINQAVIIDVLANDTDPDGDALSITSVSPPSNGTATINADNTISYTPDQDFAGDDSFSYTVSDGNGGTSSATVSVTVNDKSMQIITTINVNSQPFGIDVNPLTNKIYASHFFDESISVIDGSIDMVSDVIFTGNTTTPVIAGINPNTNLIYVNDQRSDSVLVIDGETNTITNTISVSPQVTGGAVNPSMNKIYIDNNWLVVIDGSTDTILKSIENSCSSSMSGLAVNPVTDTVYQSCARLSFRDFPGSLSVIIIDGSTDTVTGEINVTNSRAAGAPLVMNSITNTLYLTDVFSSSIFVIDGNTNTVTSEIPLEISSGSGKALAINERTNILYVTSNRDDTISAIDAETNELIDTILVGESPRAVTVNQETNKVYVTNTNNVVTVLQGVER